MRTSGLLVPLLFVGCATAAPARDAGRDGGRSLPDAFLEDGSTDGGPTDGGPADAPADAPGPLDAGTDAGRGDAGRDAGGIDAGGDAGGTDAGGTDAGPVAPTIDGVLGASEWAGATMVTSTTATDWTGDELRSLRALLLADALYLAIEGTIEGGNAMLVYVDRAQGTAEGVALATLTDSTGALDDAMTAGFTTPATVLPDLGWGTVDLSRAATGADDRMGWRDFIRAASPADLYWILPTEAATVCGATVCETRLPRTSLDLGAGATRPRTIAIFARIANATGLVSPNQTLPMDDPTMPRTVTMLLTLSDP